MSLDNSQELRNQSNLLQNTSDINQQALQNKPTSTNTFDDLPIGGKKFQFTQFPQEGDVPKKPLKKPPARFRKKMEGDQNEKNSAQTTAEQINNTQAEDAKKKSDVVNPDDLPLGGKKVEIPEFPEQGEQAKKPVKKPPARFADRMNKYANKQQTPKTGDPVPQNNNPSAKSIDDQPIGGGSKNNFDNQPIGGGNKAGFDDQPIGGGNKKFQMSQYPEQGQAPKPPVKKAAKKAAKVPVKYEEPDQLKPPPVNVDDLPIGGGKKDGTLDELPIGKAVNNFAMMSQFPQGDQQQAPVETNYTMAQKLKSKAVKLKVSGMQDMLALLESNPNSQQLAEIEIGKLLKQTNPACLEKILQCMKVWVQINKKWGDDEVKNCIENGYINGKPNTKKLTVEIVDSMYQKSPDVVQMSILVGLKGKVPKNLAGYIAFLNQLLTIYGMKRLKYLKPYFTDIVVILNREKLVAVKTEGMNILKQSYKWLTKEVVEPLTKDLKEGLKKQLDTFWQGHDKNLVMTAPKDIPQANDGKPKKKMDAYQLSEAVDIFKKYNQKFSQTVINEEKWNEKVKMMQQFINAANVPKLAHNSDFRHINQLIRRLINHSNFNVVLSVLKILAVLSKGLRRHFAGTVKSQFSNVISKFRDKKTQMIDETFNTLNEFNYCISIQDVIDDVKEGLGDKTPNMKINILNWIGKFVEKKVQEKDDVPDKAKDAIRSIFPIFQKLLADGVAQVRDAMVKNIGKMKILMGDDFFAPMDKKMSKGQADKIGSIKSQMPPRKVSKEKQKKQDKKQSSMTQGPPSKAGGKAGGKTMQNNSMISNQGRGDISDDVQDLIPKMNHSDWQKRKQSAEALISLISNNMQSKINSTVLFDLLGTLKIRVADPNKNNVKYFVQLTTLVFQTMGQRDLKNNARNFICALADGLSDKVEANRKEIALAINKIGGIFGRQQLLTILGSYLDSDKESRTEILNIILENADYLQRADTKQFPKGIIKGLIDKNKQIRNLAEKLLQRIHQKTGIETFKNLAKNQRPAIAKDLNTLFTKYEGQKMMNTSTLSKGVSPPKNNNVNTSRLQQPPVPQPPSGKKISGPRSDSKNSKAHQQSFDNAETEQINISHQRQFYSTIQSSMNNQFIKQSRSFVEGNQQFAPLKVLSTQRVHRQQKQERYPWTYDNILESQQDEFIQSLQSLFKSDLAKKMLSIDYKKVTEAASHIIKLSKDIAHHNSIRQVYDLIFKWVFLRLWGGNPPSNPILQVLPHVMSILEKKKLAINDSQVNIIVAILRQSFITGYMNDYKVSQSLYSVTKLLIALSSGDRLLKKLLKQYSVELTSIHRHIRKEATDFYRVGLSKLIKNELMDYVGNGGSLQQASRIKQLKNDPQFVDLLYKRFHENVLDSFGFRNSVMAPPQLTQSQFQQQQQQSIQRQQPAINKRIQDNYQSNSMKANNTQTRQNNIIEQRQTIKTQQTIQPQPQVVVQPPPPQQVYQPEIIQPQMQQSSRQGQFQRNQPQKQNNSKPEFDEQLDLRIYAAPPPGNPLGRYLAKLLTPHDLADNTLAFFNSYFAEGGQKISSELTTYANIIFGAILRSVKFLIQHRTQYAPQKIVNQINLLQQAIKCKFVISNIDQQLLYHGTKFALYQLVYEDENKTMIAQDLINKGIDFKPDQFVKVINGIMLRILENACPQEVVNILLNILNKQLQMPQISQKTISLIIKCLGRVSNSYSLDINPQRTKQFILRAVEHFNIINFQRSLQEFQPNPEQKLKTQDSIIKSIKQIINELIKNYGQELWVHYQNAMNQSKFADNHIAAYFQFMGIPYPENIQSFGQQDENLKKINELLSKAKTFDAGVLELKKYMSGNQQFSPVQYFTSRGYEQKFIVLVMNALEGIRPKRTPTKRQARQQKSQNSKNAPETSNQSSIQDRIQKLRMRFDQGPQNRADERPQIQQPATTTASSMRREQQRGEERAQQIKRRIDEMRNRLKN